MTATKGDDVRLVPVSGDDPVGVVVDMLNYRGVSPDVPKLFGPEIELFFGAFRDGKLSALSQEESEQLASLYAERKGEPPSREPMTSTFEIAGPPLSFEQVKGFEQIPMGMGRFKGNINLMCECAQELGLSLIPTSHGLHINHSEIITDEGLPGPAVVNMERYQAIVPTTADLFGRDFLHYAGTTAGIHVSTSYNNTQELWDQVRRLYYLSLFFDAIGNNGIPVVDGEGPHVHSSNPRLAIIESRRNDPDTRIGIDPLFLRVRNGEEFLRMYVERILHSPMLAYYPLPKREGDEPKLKLFKGKPLTFAELEEQGLNTVSNWTLAASFFWHGVKLPELPIECGNGFNARRLENRFWPSGGWQADAAIAIQALMTIDEQCGRDIDKLLEKFGFSWRGPAGDPEGAEEFDKAREEALKFHNPGVNFMFGRYPMWVFARNFMGIMKDSLKRRAVKKELNFMHEAFKRMLEPLFYIGEYWQTDAVIFRHLCSTNGEIDPAKVRHFIQEADPEILMGSGMCLAQLYAEGLLPDPQAMVHKTVHDFGAPAPGS